MNNEARGFVLCPDDFRYSVDSEKSNLVACISSTSDDVEWNLEVQALDNPEYEDDELAPVCAPIARVAFTLPDLRDWRELGGHHISLNYREYLHKEWGANDDIADLYLGYHIFPIFHEIDFGERKGNYFALKWHLEGGDEPELYFEGDDEPTLNVYPYEVEALIPFQSVRISFPEVPKDLREKYGDFTPQEFVNAANAWEPDFEIVRELLAKHFEPADFGPPERGMWSYWSLNFPVIAKD